MDLSVGWWWSPGGLGVKPTRIRLIHPVARARFADGRLSFGALDRIIDEFADRPPRPDERGPLVLVERGEVRVATAAGLVTLLGDARVDDGKLMRLDARMPAARLRTGGWSADGAALSLRARTTGDRLAIDGTGAVRTAA